MGALLDPLADKVLLVSVYVTLGVAGQIWAWLVVLVVFRDIMIVGGFLLIQAIAALPKPSHPLFISKVNTGVQVAMVGYVLARRGLGAEAGLVDLVLGHCGRRDDGRFGIDLSRAVGAHPRALGAGLVSGVDPALVMAGGLVRAPE